MTVAQQIITIALCSLATIICRFAPFLAFSSSRETPKYIKYIGNALSGATFGMLVVYCFKDVSFFKYPYCIPELLAGALVAGLHIWRRNTLLSVFAGVAFYMVLVQLVF